ncbi:MAG TPA: sulfatase [Solirubrobacterales bacterium]|jgi:arylsulfatase A-like enzyme
MPHAPRITRWRFAALATLVFGALLATALTQLLTSETRAAASSSRPNVVLLLTDDQTLEEMSGLPETSSLIGGQGANFSRAYISYPLCCPSRTAILTGQYMHNNGVHGNSPPTGGWQRFHAEGLDQRDLPIWLQNAGYYNVQVGKYLNGYTGSPAPVPPGWNEWYGKLSEYDAAVAGGRLYYNYQMREDPPPDGGVRCPSGDPAAPGQPFTCHYGSDPADYQTDVYRQMAVEAIHRLSNPSKGQTPFFLNVDFNAPHSPYDPAPRHMGTLAGLPLQPPPGLNEKNMSDKPFFLRRLPRLGRGKLALIDQRRRSRLEMLRSVDDAVAAIVHALAAEGQLDNTYLIFASDNGYFSGEHRIRQGKYLPHEPSSHVPLMIRGPGIPAGGVSYDLASNVDFASTIAQMTGATPLLPQDGRSLLPFAEQPSLRTSRPILLEGDTGPSIDDEGAEGPVAKNQADFRHFKKKLRRKMKRLRKRCNKLKRKSPRRAFLCYRQGVRNIEQEPVDTAYKLRAPAYRGIRTDRYALYLYATGEIELYDMWRDPYQLSSVAKARRYRKPRKWLLARLDKLARCSGAACSAGIGPEPRLAKKRFACKRKGPVRGRPSSSRKRCLRARAKR